MTILKLLDWRLYSIENLEFITQTQEDSIRKSKREYYLRNRDHFLELERQYRKQNKDHIRDRKRELYERNKEKERQSYIDAKLNPVAYSPQVRPSKWEREDFVRSYKRENYFRNKSKVSQHQRDYKRQYRIRKKDHVTETNREYYARNKERATQDYLDTKSNPDDYFPRASPAKSWKSPELVREYFESIASDLKVSISTDWYRISRPQIVSLGGMFYYFFLFYFFCFFERKLT
jgi:hypothetical protein